jgi:hypothetical protein
MHRPVFYLIRDVSETGFSLRLQAEPIQVNPVENLVTVCGSETEPSSIYWAQVRRFQLKTKTESILRNVAV